MPGVPIPSDRARSTAKLNLSRAYGDFLSEKAQVTANSSARQSLAAAHLGVWLKQRINERTFRLAVLVTVIVVGVTGLAKYLF